MIDFIIIDQKHFFNICSLLEFNGFRSKNYDESTNKLNVKFQEIT